MNLLRGRESGEAAIGAGDHVLAPANVGKAHQALRHDEEFAYVAAWEFTDTGTPAVLHKEDLTFEYVHPTQRSYK